MNRQKLTEGGNVLGTFSDTAPPLPGGRELEAKRSRSSRSAVAFLADFALPFFKNTLMKPS